MTENQGYKILMVDDDEALLRVNQAFFAECGYEVACAKNACDAKALASTVRFDCVVLDIDLPDSDGFDVCADIRESTSLPIVFLSAHTENENRIRSLSIGGDDFVDKFCSLTELELRVRLRIQRRREDQPAQILRFGSLAIDLGARTITYDGKAGEFSRIEFDVLAFLARNPGRIYSYEQLYDSVWHEPLNMGRHSVQARMADIRAKLSALCPGKAYIRTIRYKGYQFTP